MSGRTAMNTNAIFLRHTLCTLRLGDRGPWRLTKSDAQPWSGPTTILLSTSTAEIAVVRLGTVLGIVVRMTRQAKQSCRA
jgi:hypothetical protein